ncbi:MAG TPA: hypothetical protein H9953_08020 [Candidatus Fusicatenibacter intestinipullorum]|nr:hypothetical protein [Candidatus Fusicatenibacter intestinipullorum]
MKLRQLTKRRQKLKDEYESAQRRLQEEIRQLEQQSEAEEQKFFYKAIKKIGFAPEDRAVLIGGLIVIKEKVTEGDADAINDYISKYNDFISNPRNGIKDELHEDNAVTDGISEDEDGKQEP